MDELNTKFSKTNIKKRFRVPYWLAQKKNPKYILTQLILNCRQKPFKKFYPKMREIGWRKSSRFTPDRYPRWGRRCWWTSCRTGGRLAWKKANNKKYYMNGIDFIIKMIKSCKNLLRICFSKLKARKSISKNNWTLTTSNCKSEFRSKLVLEIF